MEFKLTTTQKIFYDKKLPSEVVLWNQGAIVTFREKYKYSKLNDALNCLVETFEGLRVKIVETKDGPVSCIKEFQTQEYPFFVFSDEEQLVATIEKYVNTPIDMYECLFRSAVFHTENFSGIVICSHHMIIDGFSAQIVFSFLNNYLKEQPWLPGKIEDYKEHVEKENAYRRTKRYFLDKLFWEKEFSSVPVRTVLSESNASLNYDALELNASIASELFRNIKSFCARNDISITSFFHGVYSVCLYRNYGHLHFTMGIPILNRTTIAELNTVGLYMHIVPLVITLADTSFLENVKKIEETQMNLFRHQRFSQGEIQELLKEKGLSETPLFDIVSNYQEFTCTDDYKLEFKYSKSLSVSMEIHLQSFNDSVHQLKMRYRKAVIGEAEARRLLDSFIYVANYVIDNEDSTLTKIPMYAQEEVRSALKLAKGPSVKMPKDATIYQLFEKTARSMADNCCIRIGNQSITYGKLLVLSEALDRKIQEVTRGKKSIIAVMAERSIEMYVAIYGIIRGGNAYLPIAVEYPKNRIDYILKDSNAAMLVFKGDRSVILGNIPFIDLTEFIESPLDRKEEFPCKAEGEDTAYVIYTSGSTGKPKGVKITHTSVVNRILWMNDAYPLKNNGVILQKTPYTFDVSAWEIFWWGMCGGSMVASRPGEHAVPERIMEEVDKHEVTHLHFVPSVFELFLTYLEKQRQECNKFHSVKHVFLSGEVASASMVRRFYNLFDHRQIALHNLYGPTESTIDVTYYDCGLNECDPIPIGRPIYNTSIYVVDEHMNPLPCGVKGELCIGGANVSQGYVNNPLLTAEKFIQNPFDHGKLYKTGDLAFFRNDGQIVFCGRMDEQLKLNGQRVEVKEIEAVIGTVPGVDLVAVVVSKINDRNRLVAYYCGEKAKEEEIGVACEKELPQYMIPSVIVHLEKMPFNQNGKLDKKALEKIKSFKYEKQSYEAPINEQEKEICKAFCTHLKEETVSRKSNFFELGGDSLAMLSLLFESPLQKISAAEFIANATPEKLALLINGKQTSKRRYMEVLWETESKERAVVLFPFAGGGAQIYGKLADAVKRVADNVSVYFAKYPHSLDECEGLAQEIANTLGESQLYFYSHCVGSAVAMHVLNILEKEKKCIVRHYLASASMPRTIFGKYNPWNQVSNKMLKKILVKAGASFENLSDDKVSEVLCCFRQDTDFAMEYYATTKERIACPTTLVINKRDIFTRRYKKAKRVWEKYTHKIQKVYYITSPSHYFQSENCDMLAKILLSSES